MKSTSRISVISRTLLAFAAVCLTVSIFVPIWRIDLDAPQYPEGLRLLIFSDKLGGNVDIINGLNHYIGMKTLHAEEFVEFTVLPYIIGAFALFCLIAVISGRKKVLYILLTAFALFGILAMYDFWRWEYDYGHNLNPNAAIIVPGMAYQPPLIGFKQLLNFGAYSVPALGGWLFVAGGLLMLISVIYEVKFNKGRTAAISATSAALMLILSGCGQPGPQPIKLNTDNCDYCRMTIADARFCSELLTAKGRIYKFDDVACMVNYMKENHTSAGTKMYIADYLNPNALVDVEKASYIKGGTVKSPMGGNTAAFSNADSAAAYSGRTGGFKTVWSELQH
jgi:copper chaperone NosL